MLRKVALQVSLFLLLLLPASDVLAQSGLRAISDFSYLRNDLRSVDQKIEDFITDVRAGNRQAFKYVQYETLEGVIVRLRREAERHPSNRNRAFDRMIAYLIATTASDVEQARAILERATLPGIFNMDPRVRLVATDWLRGIRPSASMQRAVKLAIGVDIEVIRYDHNRGEFVFRAPRILETVASSYEYYREKDLDWPTSFQVGGPGPNNNADLLYQGAPQLRDGPTDNTTTGLTARRWGGFAPTYDEDRGYMPMTAEEREAILAQYAEELREAEERAQARWGGDVWAPDLDQYRHYPREQVRDEEGVRYGAQLLMEQSSYALGAEDVMVPLGQGRKYIYLNRHGHIVLGNPWAELTKLDEYITRKVWWEKIRAGQRNVMTYLSKDTFSTLFRSIDGEVSEWIPMLQFATAEPMMLSRNDAAETDRLIDVFITGLHRNPVLSNKYVILRALKDIYVDRYEVLDTTPEMREKINIALWEFRREANRLDYVAGRVLTAESITVGKRPVNDWAPILPVSGAGTGPDDVLDLGFRLPNDEIRASGYRLISMEPTNMSDPRREAKVNLIDRFNSTFYAYRRADNTLITWYNNRTEWIARAAGVDITADVENVDSPWIYNFDQMERAQNLINSILAGDPEILRTITWPDMEAAILLTLRRVQIQYALAGAGATQPVTTFMDQLRSQDVIVNNPRHEGNPNVRDRMFIDEEQVAREKSFPNNTFSEEKREAIKTAAIAGMFNRDQRVRLTSYHFLRRIGPDESMLEAVILARSIVAGAGAEHVEPDTDDYLNTFIDTNVYERRRDIDYTSVLLNKYKGVIPDDELDDADKTLQYDVLNPAYTVEDHEYQMGMISNREDERGTLIQYFGLYQMKSPGEELDKLYRFIQRRRLVRAIKRGDVNAIIRLSRADFGVLSEFIDAEYGVRVPFISFHTTAGDPSARTALPSRFAVFDEDDIAVIKRGIDSTNFLVQKGTAEYLIHFYNFYTGFSADDPVKREIRDAMYFYKQDDIAVEEFVLAFEGENPDGRAVIMAGTPLSRDLNPGGERVYRTLPNNILKDIRDAVLDETQRLPESLRAILGLITVRATDADANLTYESGGESATVRERPGSPSGPSSETPPGTTGGAGGGTTTPAATDPAATGGTAPAAGGGTP